MALTANFGSVHKKISSEDPMPIVVHHFPATQVLRVNVLTQGRAHVPFLNWQVSAQAAARRTGVSGAFSGAGLYGLCYQDRLIYIGSFLGSGGVKVDRVKAATFSGDVVKGRWWQHFGSITGRSHILSVAPKTLDLLQQEFGQNHPMVIALRGATPALFQDAGCLGALNRLRFAARHFDEFAGALVDPARILSHFCYIYARYDVLAPSIDAHELSQRITAVEHSLIRQYHPEVNTAGRIAQGNPVAMTCTQAQKVMGDALL